jgi:predicted HTH transcriptional regulator
MDCKELMELIKAGERRSVELKQSMSWDEPNTQAKITRSILAMSNIRDGGKIIIGAKRNDDDTYEPEGLYPEHKDTYNSDNVADHVSNYADPYVKFTLEAITCGENTFIVIRVDEFEEVPVICKNDGRDLRRSAVYVRSRRKPESVEVRDEAEMREIIEMAVEKSVRKLFQRLANAGVSLGVPLQPTDNDFYNQEISDLL